MKGTIEKVWENKTQKEGKKYLTVKVGGQRYSLWDEKYFDAVKPGMEIEYESRRSGKYQSITSLKPVGQEAQNGNSEETGLGEPEYRSRSMRRMSCLRAASTLTASLNLKMVSDPVDFTIGVARRFEKYIGEEHADKGLSTQEKKKG
jgi:hypothetical protein